MAFRKVAEFKEVTLQYQTNAGGGVSFQWFTDMPGGVLGARLGSGVPLAGTNAARVTRTIPLDGIEGSEFYPVLTPNNATQLRLFSGVVYLRPIGVYVDGSIGEFWSTPPISVGT